MKGPIIGFRLWEWREFERSLFSLTSDFAWLPGANVEAEDSPTKEKLYGAPGIHGYYRFDHNRDEGFPLEPCFVNWYSIEVFNSRRGLEGRHWIAGAFLGWGETVLHEFGFRCLKARPIGIFFDPDLPSSPDSRYKKFKGSTPDGVLEIGSRYGLPICSSHAELVSYAQEWGSLITERLLFQ